MSELRRKIILIILISQFILRRLLVMKPASDYLVFVDVIK
jgi:hypothetical protein